MLVFADKTTDFFEMDSNYYRKLLNNNFTRTYRKADQNKKNIVREAKKLSEKINFDKKMDCYADRQSFIILKDHKDNFKSNTKCRLTNSAKSQMGKVSKNYL